CDGSGTFESQRADLDIQERDGDALKYVRNGGKESISAYLFDGKDMTLAYRIAYVVVSDRHDNARTNDQSSRWLASVGQLWEWCSLYCHGSSYEAGKVMGLAPFGDPDAHADLATLSLDNGGQMRIDLQALFHRFRTPNSSGADIA